MTKWMNKFRSSFYMKILSIAIIGLVLSMIFSIILSTYNTVEIEKVLTNEYINNVKTKNEGATKDQIELISDSIDEYIGKLKEELNIMSSIIQSTFDEGDVIDQMSSEISERFLLISNARYGDLIIRPSNDSIIIFPSRAKNNKAIHQAAVLSKILPSFSQESEEVLRTYYTSVGENSFTYMVPSINFEDYELARNIAMNNDLMTMYPDLIVYWENEIYNVADLDELLILTKPSGSQNNAIVLLNPIFDAEREKVIGILHLEASLEYIHALLDERSDYKSFAVLLTEGDEIISIDPAGAEYLGIVYKKMTLKDELQAILDPVDLVTLKDSAYKNVQELDIEKICTKSFSDVALKEEFYAVAEMISIQDYYDYKLGVKNDDWQLVFFVSKEEILLEYEKISLMTNRFKVTNIIGQIAISIIVFMVIMRFVVRYYDLIIEDLKKLVKIANQVRHRNYDVDIKISSEDEVGELALTLREMNDEIKHSFAQLSAQNSLLRDEIALRKANEKQVKYLEDFDTITSLPSKRLFQRFFKDYLSHLQNGDFGCVLRIALEDVDKLNEVYGSDYVNEVLRIVGMRIYNHVKPKGFVSKIDGNEFAVLLYDEESRDALLMKINKLRILIKEEIEYETLKSNITASIGISFFPDDSIDDKVLFENATSALVQAKSYNKDTIRLYDVEKNIESKMHYEMQNELMHALEKKELYCVFQPLVDKNEHVYNCELLIRWKNEKYGFVPPDKFIPIAEKSKMIIPIGDFIIQEACKQIKHLQNHGKAISIAVNISSVQFEDPDFIIKLKHVIEKEQIDPHYLEFEVTEGLLIEQFEPTIELLEALREMGIKISIDDFGTGYSSLGYIQNLPIDKLKIDRVFVKDIPNEDTGDIAKIICQLGKAVNLEIVAEGVETIEQRDFLLKNNVDYIQGYYYSKPLSKEDFFTFIQ